MPRVLICTDGLDNGGAERQLSLLASHLPQGWDVLVVSLGTGEYERVLRDAGVPLCVIPRASKRDVRPVAGMWSEARRFRPDVVHAWGWMSCAAAAPYCAAAGVPLIDGTIRTGSLPSRRALVSRLPMRLARNVIANSQAGLTAYGIPVPRGVVVRNGFDPARLEGSPAIPRTAPDGRTRVIMVARLWPGKDWPTFFEAARLLSVREPGTWEFTVAGAGPDTFGVVAEAAPLVASGTVSIVAAGTEVVPFLRRSDIGVLLTDPRYLAEGCSNAIMEYMACGLPVVCTNSGGNGELVVDGVTGYVVRPGDSGCLVDRLSLLCKDPDACAEMGHAGRARIASEFTVQRMVEATVAVYNAAIVPTRSVLTAHARRR